jgi:hypothetical protein
VRDRLTVFTKGQRGTLVLESGILLPAYLIMLLFLISLVKLAVVFAFSNELAYSTTSYSARAANLFDRAYFYLAEEQSDIEAMRQFIKAAKSANSDNGLGKLLEGISDGAQEVTDSLGKELLVDVRLNEFDKHALFRKDSISVKKATFADKMVEVVIAYKTTIPVPFKRQDFEFTAGGYERQWIGKW